MSLGYFSIVYIFCNFFQQRVVFISVSRFAILVKLILKYFILGDAIANKILYFLLDCPLLTGRNSAGFV